MPGLELTLPLETARVEAWRRFCQEMAGSRRMMHAASRHRLGIQLERLALVESPLWSYTVATLEADDIDAVIADILTSDLPFETWYRERLQDLHGISLTRFEAYLKPGLSAPQELVFEWKIAGSASENNH